MKIGVAGVAESETTAPQPNIQFEKMANLTWGVYIFFISNIFLKTDKHLYVNIISLIVLLPFNWYGVTTITTRNNQLKFSMKVTKRVNSIF